MDTAKLRYEPLPASYCAAAAELLRLEAAVTTEMLSTLKYAPQDIMAGFFEDKLLALADVGKPVEESFLSVFVDPTHRGQGLGSAFADHMERKLQAQGTKAILSCFNSDNEIARSFARKRGYLPHFFSAKMERIGAPFSLEPLPVRLYTDDDYYACQALSARAFHEMRLRVGCFANSKIAQPSESSRKAWLEDAKDIYVYLDSGEIVACGQLFEGEVVSVSVRTDYQGRGIGKKFIMLLCNEILLRGHDRVTLWCVVGNYAKNIYQRLGFVEKYVAEYPRKML